MGKKNSSKSNYIMQGSILAIASIVSRIIGLLYRLPVTNIITDHGNDYYSAAYEIYNVILLISSYSLPLAVSKVVSAKVALGEYRNSWRAFKGALYMALVVGAAGSALTFFGAGFFTGTLLNTPESELCLKVLALAVFVMAVMGVLRGFFQGMGTMMPTAISQIIEQIVNAIVSIAAASYLFSYGVKLDAAAGITNGKSGAIYGCGGKYTGYQPGRGSRPSVPDYCHAHVQPGTAEKYAPGSRKPAGKLRKYPASADYDHRTGHFKYSCLQYQRHCRSGRIQISDAGCTEGG